MEIVQIYKEPYIFSIKYDDEDENEFDRLFDQWNDMGYVAQFFDLYQDYLKTPFWQNALQPEEAARQVIQEAADLEDLFDELYQNTLNGEEADFDSHFCFLDGKYKCEFDRPPMKSYGTRRPSFLRIYAIKMQDNTYLITGGGIKLAEKIQDSPELKDHVLSNIDKVRKFLIENGIMDSDDLKNN